MSEDRIVQRTVNAGLERTVEAGKPQDLRAISAACIDVADQPDLRFGKRPGLVGAQRVHGAKVVDGREPFDDDAVTRKTQGAACERDGDHHRQQLRGEADREREREHDRREPWPLEQHVGGEHEEHEKEGQTQDQEAELAYTDLEGIGRPAPAELRRETADASLPARPADQRGCGPADDGGPHEDEIGFLGGLLGPTGNLAVVLFGRVRLAGQQGLVDEEVTRFDQPAVGGNNIAGGELHDIARHQLLEMQLALAPRAENQRFRRHRAAERIDGVLRAYLLHEVERNAERDDGDDDEEAGRVAGKRRQRAGKQQDQNERIEEAQDEAHRQRLPLVHHGIVGAVARKPSQRLRIGQPFARGLQVGEAALERQP